MSSNGQFEQLYYGERALVALPSSCITFEEKAAEEDKVSHRHHEERALLTPPFRQGDIIQFRGASQEPVSHSGLLRIPGTAVLG